MSYISELCLHTAFKVLLLLPLLIVCGKKKRIYIWLFILISSLNALGLGLGMLWSRHFHLNWNWGGKIVSTLISTAFVLFLNHFIKTIPFTEYKISFKQQITKKRTILFVMFIMLLIIIGNFIGQKANFVIETVLFQATMPGIEEELSFRGIYLALLNKVFEKKYKIIDCRFGWGLIIVSILFGIVHSLSISLSSGLNFDALNFFVTGTLGFCFGILAEYSGSLILSTTAHNAFNTIGYLIKVIK